MKRRYSLGKLQHRELESLIKDYISDLELKDDQIISGSKVGEDAAVIDTEGDYYLVVKTDPITFATDEIGYYVVNVNVNDVVCTGARPNWFQTTILLPEKSTTEKLIRFIFKGIHDTCKSMGISVVGGHTEITSGIGRPIVIGSLIGKVEKSNLVLNSRIEAGDDLILTKGIFIEGTSIIAREKEDLLKNKGFDSQFITSCKNFLYNPGISVYKEALLANDNFKIKGMHDPTEGGLACGIAEMGIASNAGVIIEKKNIKILPESKKLSKIFNLNPLGTISSGSLLIAIDKKDTDDLIQLLEENEIEAMKIGKFIEKQKNFLIKKENGVIHHLKYSERDEITKLF